MFTLGKSGLYTLVQERDLKIIASNTRLCTEQTASSLIKIRYYPVALQFIASTPASAVDFSRFYKKNSALFRL
jgi:hypothetical protein